jgi:hypothetical protein
MARTLQRVPGAAGGALYPGPAGVAGLPAYPFRG